MALPPTYWWPRGFPGEKAQVPTMRAWMEGFLPACDALDDLLLIAAELAANAVTHTRSGQPAGQFTVDVTWSPDCARVVVGDQGSDEVPDSPGPGQPAYAETGRGLLLVHSLSAASSRIAVWALAITEAALGPNHPHTAIRLNNLATTHRDLGRPADALPLQERALAITEATLGPDHPDTAIWLSNLAAAYRSLGRPADALALEERARHIRQSPG
jgi:anti-sigma regulatory factor (Ser/Thr protein kinase)